VTKKGNIELTDRTKLTGVQVGIQRGSPALDELSKIPSVRTISYDTLEIAFQNLTLGFIDAVVTDSARAAPFVNNKANGLKLVDNAFASVNYAIAVCKDRQDVVDGLNKGLASVRADGTLANLINTYLK
jgi:ABC-type amino acid transport substrate-binding protein